MSKHKPSTTAPTMREEMPSDSPPRTIAFYLPQFHPIPENDAWWGKGFTEWTNVTRAEPLFEGHHQPRRPADLGYYDLRIPEIMEQQAALAREYGIHGFCYYYYWFAGRRLLDKPLDRMLQSGSPDFPFCLCWANENWSRRWDGSEQEVLMKQEYGPDYARRIIRDMLPFLLDKRYIRVDGKPLLLVYRVDIVPDCAEMLAIWREEAVAAGLPGLYLVRVESFVDLDPRPYGFDAACEFPPHLLQAVTLADRNSISNLAPAFEGYLFDYSMVAANYASKPAPAFKRFKGIVPAWDNTARKKLKPTILNRSSPALYKAWLGYCLHETVTRFQGDERLLFINAWNEWAEGCYLEPDQTYGHQYLEATRDALNDLMHSPQNRPGGNSIQAGTHGMDFAIALFNNGQTQEAFGAFLSIVDKQPNDPLAFVYLGLLALGSQLPEDANNFFAHAIDVSQDRANTMAAIAQRCMQAGDLAFAERYFSAAIETQPSLQAAYSLLADVWEQQGRREEAMLLMASLVEGAAQPQQSVLARYVSLAHALGDMEHEILACLRATHYPDSHAQAITLLSLADNTSAEYLRDETLRFAQRHNNAGRTTLPAGHREHLRIGFVLGETSNFSVAARLEPILAKLDPQRFETYVFAIGAFPGETAQRMFLLADKWHRVEGSDADTCDQLINQARIDVLINLNGHASLTALQPFSRRNAPLQLNWSVPALPLAMDCIDHALLDSLAFGDSAMRDTCVEAAMLIDHPTAWQFPHLPDRLGGARSTFCFGNMTPIGHITLTTWAAWASILRATPDASLQLNAAGASDEARQRLLQRFVDEGIEQSRILWSTATDSNSCCRAWQGIDLGLTPLSGDHRFDMLCGAWVGVASLASTHGNAWSIATARLLAQLGQDHFITTGPQDYVARAVALAADRNALRAQGKALRERLMTSPFVDTAGFAKAFGATLESLWTAAGGTSGDRA